MKKILFIILSTFINYFLINAQNIDNSYDNFGECGTDAIHQMLMQTDPVYRAGILSLEEQIQSILQNPSKHKILPAVYTIPVVVHVIEDGIFNISDVTIQGAIDGLNDRFRNIIGTDIEIEFCLAVRDSNCNTTTGINRVDGRVVVDYAANGIYHETANPSGESETAIKDLSIWPYTDYYNIWVVNKIGLAAGYAYYPTVGNIYDGTVIAYDYMKYSRNTLTHELAHGFFLYHTFEGDGDGGQCPANVNCAVDGDKVCETHPHKRDDGCTGTNSCTGGSLSLVSANYMSYCPLRTEFVQGQKERMRATAIITPRKSLLSSQGCVGSVAPVSDLSATSICAGLIVYFQDISANCPNKWSWSFPGGTPSSSTEQNPTVTYNTSGTYSVSLTASYETISGNKITKNIVVYRIL
ncbi:MAG: PKD domain-containing protein [Cytophagales bacterium]|nr:PKD domain-containing protein [Cytophagales bacterium]